MTSNRKKVVLIGGGVGAASCAQNLVELRHSHTLRVGQGSQKDTEAAGSVPEFDLTIISASAVIKRPTNEFKLTKVLRTFEIEAMPADHAQQELEASWEHAIAKRLIIREDGQKFVA